MPGYYKPYYKRKRGMDGHKSFSGFLKQNARTLSFTIKNPTNPTSVIGFTLPENSTYSPTDFYTCTMVEFGNDLWVQNQTPQTVAGDTIGGSTLGGFSILPQIGNAQVLWELNAGNLVGNDYSYSGTDTNLTNSTVSGLAVAQSATTSFSFNFNMGIIPSAFWAATTQYGKFKPLDCTLVVVPRKVKPWSAGATFRDNAQELGTTGQYEGIGQVPNSILQEGTLGGAQQYSNPALSFFPTKTWYVHIPRNWSRNDVTVGTTPFNSTVSAYIWSNWQSWLMFGQTDSKLRIRLDDLLRRSRSAKPTNGGCRVTKRFLQPTLNPTMSLANMIQGNLTDLTGFNPQELLSNAGMGFSSHPVEAINIPDTRGFTPGWWAASQSELGKTPFYQPLSLPMGDFVVDTSEWQTSYIARTDGGAYKGYQNFTPTGNLVAGGTSDAQKGKPIGMNPPLFWDVYFIPRFYFSGSPCGLVGAMLGQS